LKASQYFFLGVIITIVIGNSIIFFSESDSKIIYANWILIINSLTAAGLSAMILLKDRDNDKGYKTNILLTLGLIFWFIANIIWAYYEVVLDIVSPVPSLADLFLMSAYGFLIYRLISIYKKLGHITNKKILILIISGTGLFLIYILNLTLDLTELSNFRGLMLFVVTIAYPTLNSILTVLALMILLRIKNEKHHFIPWICELIGFLAIVVGDSWFAIIVLTAFVEQLWMSALLLSAHYLLIAAGLIWYLRYYIKWQSKDLIYKILTNVRRNIIFKKVLVSSIIAISFLIFASFYYTNVYSGDQSKDFFIKKSSSYPQLFSSTYNEDSSRKDIVIGAILPFTGSFSSLGKSIKVALEKAEYDVNKHFEVMNSSSRFNLLMANSKTSPEETLVAIKKLHENGANIIVGPAIGTTVNAAKEYADANNIILISYSSTSPFLSIEGDNLFRLVPDDTNQGKIVAERMISDGIKVIVPIWRGGIYANELYKSTKSYFEKLGGEVEEGINYKPYTGKFATSLHRINFLMWNQELEKLNAMVSDAVKKYGAKSVGVYVISFDEITPILIQSTLYEDLGKVRWYGSDKIAQNHQITKNVDSALFAMKTNFSNPLYSIDSESKKLHDLKEVLEKQLHEVSSLTYSALAYDSYWIATLSLDKNNTTTLNKSNENLTTKLFKEIIVETAESFDDGISGKIKINKAGDRINGNYDFWIVAKDNDTQSYEWEKEHIFG
jgi:branched-chain amino acid transport system substrate-binding protein